MLAPEAFIRNLYPAGTSSMSESTISSRPMICSKLGRARENTVVDNPCHIESYRGPLQEATELILHFTRLLPHNLACEVHYGVELAFF